MRINLVEQNHFQEVFKTFFNKSFDKNITGISIDSRNIHKNDLFIAIKGEKFDGNDFLDQALQMVQATHYHRQEVIMVIIFLWKIYRIF